MERDLAENDKQSIEPPERKPPPWIGIKLSDLEAVELDAPLAGLEYADYHELGDRYGDAMQAADPESPERRVWALLWALNGMQLHSNDVADPFGAQSVSGAFRSPIPKDFRGEIDVIQEAAFRTADPLVKARLSDLCWVIDRRGKSALSAIEAYTNIVLSVRDGKARYRHEPAGRSHLSHQSRDFLRRALWIGRGTGWSGKEAQAAAGLCVELRREALTVKDRAATAWFSALDFTQGLSDFDSLAADIETLVEATPEQGTDHDAIQLLRLAAQSFHRAKSHEAEQRCLLKVAECFVQMSSLSNSAMLAASNLEDAISSLRGIPSQKKRRIELQKQLIDVQSRIGEELKTFSHELNLSDLIKETEDGFERLSFKDSLFSFAAFISSPPASQLKRDAEESIRKYPFSGLFPPIHLDHEGKTIHRSSSGGFGEANQGAIEQQIATAESQRRHVIAHGSIEPALNVISNLHAFSDDEIMPFTRASGFVPEHQAATFARGFIRFFRRDYVSAIYILTPLLESGLRHVLKAAGHVVSRFDDESQTQEDRTISQLFGHMRMEMEDIFGDARVADIENVFLKKPGPYLRNALCHGLVLDGQPYGADAIYACWLVFHLCMVPLLPYRDRF